MKLNIRFEDETKLIEFLLKLTEQLNSYVFKFNIKKEGTIDIEYNLAKGKTILNTYYSIALLYSITKFYNLKIKDQEPTMEKIRETFSELYEKLKLGLNKRFLERDLKELSGKRISDVKRNFFAHSGFESTIIEIDEDKIRWKENRIYEIIKWLEKPEK